MSTDGLFLPRVEDDLSLAAVANDARAAIDAIQTMVLRCQGGVGRVPEHRPRRGVRQ